MNRPSSLDLQRREYGIRSFDSLWFADLKAKQIRRRPVTGFERFRSFFWKKKHPVHDLYWWASRKWDSEEMMPFKDPIEHDSIPVPGYPRKYRLANDWSIPETDLKYLYAGPLFDQNGTDELVPHQSKFRIAVSLVAQLKPLSWVIGFALVCYRYRSEILEIVASISNAT